MEVILLEKIGNLGGIGDVVKVKPGYARNYLVPSGKAKSASPENIAEFEQQKVELEKTAATALVQAEERKQKIDGLSLSVVVKAGEEGALFGSVGSVEIIEAVAAACGEKIQKSEVLLPHGAFREIGENEVALKLHPNVIASIQLSIVSEEE